MSQTENWTPQRVVKELASDGVDIVTRMDALFWAKHFNTEETVMALINGLKHPSVLLKHEIAYVLGQMSWPDQSHPVLIKLLNDKTEHPMVRHEAGEALTALGVPTDEVFAALEQNKEDECTPVRETVELALEGLRRKREKIAQNRNQTEAAPFKSKDPVNGDQSQQDVNFIDSLSAKLRDQTGSCLWDRYKALFTLRNIKDSTEAVIALARALDEDTKSALLRHEICFVLGQLRRFSETEESLRNRLNDKDEHSMVRHEAALSLGSVACEAPLSALPAIETVL